MSTATIPAAIAQPRTAASAVSQLVEVLKTITDLAERYGVGNDCDGNIIEARELIEQCAGMSITEEEIVAWVRAKAIDILSRTGVPDSAISLTVHAGEFSHASWSAHGDGKCVAGTRSVDTAVSSVVDSIGSSPARAEAKRAAAKKLLAEADRISGAV